MRIRTLLSSPGFALILASLVAALPPIARASGNEPAANNAAAPEKKDTPAPQPLPDQTTKTYTNDDFGWFHPSAAATPQATGTVARPKRLDPQQDPQWYAKQVTSLEGELANVQSKESALQQFRATSSGLPTGLVLNAPTEGITTDNLIAQLESRRQQIAQQLDDLADLARVNGLPPGTVNQAVAPEQPSLTPAQREEALTSQYQNSSDRLAEDQATLDAMRQQAAAQGITLLPYVPGEGGNLTTNLLDTLNSQSSALQNNLSDAEDSARTLGIQPGSLR